MAPAARPDPPDNLGGLTPVVPTVPPEDCCLRHEYPVQLGHHCPALNKMFVATLLGLGDRTADVFFRAPIPSSMILDIWQPGHVEYDRH